MKRVLFLFITIFPFCLFPEFLHTQNEDSLHDVFPLRPGIKYSYGFSYEGSSGDAIIYETIKDSGQIEYLVIDSTSINDSVRIWNVIEIHNYKRHRSSSMPPGVDTSYYVDDSTEFELCENLWGRHELSCFAKIWRFPLRHNYYQMKETIYRYMDTTEVKLDWEWTNAGGSIGVGTGFDTVWFSLEYGFKGQRFHEIWYNPLYVGHNTLTVEALHPPLAVHEINNNTLQSKRLHLKQNYPNPFNPSTTFLFYLENREYASLKLYNLLGQEILIIKEGEFSSGENTLEWNASKLSGGVYFCRLTTKDFAETIKILFLK